jgi:acyl-homoserine lactone acylase PvdQ
MNTYSTNLPEAAEDKGEILWDEFGIPHIYGPDLPTVIRGYGYAQMENRAELILQNIALARALLNQLRQRLTTWLPSYR